MCFVSAFMLMEWFSVSLFCYSGEFYSIVTIRRLESMFSERLKAASQRVRTTKLSQLLDISGNAVSRCAPRRVSSTTSKFDIFPFLRYDWIVLNNLFELESFFILITHSKHAAGSLSSESTSRLKTDSVYCNVPSTHYWIDTCTVPL
jgi:hypothetical protein